jgi:ABC-type multidrug transport system fused ATPase/permease subunit
MWALNKIFIIMTATTAVFQNGGLLIAIIIYVYSYLWGIKIEFSDGVAIISILIFLSMMAIYFLLLGISNVGMISAIFKRTTEVFTYEDHIEDFAKDDENLQEGIRVKLEEVSLWWGYSKEKPTDELDIDYADLKEISFEARDELVAIVGTVGCGKTSLLFGLMHELETVSGTVRTRGKFAYVEQEPFIVSGSVRDNIEFGSPKDEE